MKNFLLPVVLMTLTFGYSCSSDEEGGGKKFDSSRMLGNRP